MVKVYKLTNIRYFRPWFRALGRHPDGRIFISRALTEGVLYDMDLNGDIGNTYYDFQANFGFIGSINQILILNNGIMLVTGTTENGAIVVRSDDTTYTSFTKVLDLTPTSYIFDRGWATNADDSTILIVEYTTAERSEVDNVKVWQSKDKGLTWVASHTFTRNLTDPDHIRHIHFVDYDPYDDNFVIGTGDGNTESRLYRTVDGTDLELIGSGSQKWRSVSATFTEDFIYWGMDGFDEDGKAYILRVDKTTKELEVLTQASALMYITQKINTSFGELIVTSNAIETSDYFKERALDNKVHLYVSGDGENFIDIHSWERDESTGLFSRADNIIDLGNNQILLSMRAIVREDGLAHQYVIVIAELQKTPVPTIKIKTPNGIESIPTYSLNEIGNNIFRILVRGETRCLELVEPTAQNASSLRIYINGNIMSVAKE